MCHTMTSHGTLVTVQVADFTRARDVVAWRRRLRPPGASLVKLLSTPGARRDGGFRLGGPAGMLRQVALVAWAGPPDELPTPQGATAWTATLRAFRTRGSHHGRRPIVPAAEPRPGAPIAAITLGRAHPADVPRFIGHGVGLAAPTLDAPGLVTALTAGSPLTGNLTFSLWTSEQAMVDFAYGGDARPGHAATVRAHGRSRILREQLNARLWPIRIDGAWNEALTPHADRLARLTADLRREGGDAH